jgi:rod shape-determining protein MreC
MLLFGFKAPGAILKRLIDGLISLAGTWRSMGERPVLVACVALASVLLILDRLEVQAVNKATAVIGDQVVPLTTLVREPISWSRKIGEKLGGLFAVYAENERLKAENRRLLDWQTQAVRLGVENRSLRTMLEMPEASPEASRVNARIVADSASPFVHTRLIDIGADAGITTGMAVLTPAGMIGRVVQVGERSARILLITDLNSKIPVIVERSGDQALLAGNNSAEPTLEFLPLNPRFQIGDRVMTSGRGGILPAGLMVGEISRVEGSKVTVRPAVDWQAVDYVAVLRHAPLPPPEAAPTTDDAAGRIDDVRRSTPIDYSTTLRYSSAVLERSENLIRRAG